MKAIQTLTNSQSIEIKTTNDSDFLYYKYSDENNWSLTEIEFLPRENGEDEELVPAFTTKEGSVFYIDEFITL